MKIFNRLCIVFLFASVFSCGNKDDGVNCTEIYVYGLNVTVTDASTDEVLTTDVIVSAEDGSYTEVLTLISDSFVGAGERPGNYLITVVAEGYNSQTTGIINVELTGDECHVVPEVVAIDLQPI